VLDPDLWDSPNETLNFRANLPADVPEIANPDEFSIRAGLLVAVSRLKVARGLSTIIRNGGSYEHHREALSPEAYEGMAVNGMGLDSSLYFHGAEQVRRATRLGQMQQAAHQIMHRTIVENYGHGAHADRIYRTFSAYVPPISHKTTEKLRVTGGTHDYGEVWIGEDRVFDRKDRSHEILEARAFVKMATRLHVPTNNPTLMRLLQRRVKSETDPRFALSADEEAEVSHLLHPVEVKRSVYKVEPSELFKGTIEPWEYVLEGIRSFEAVEHNLGAIREDPILAANILRLGVSTFYNSLMVICTQAKKYVAPYDFVRQNIDTIDHYMGIMGADIRGYFAGKPGFAKDIYGFDPFTNYEQGKEPISATEARLRLLRSAEAWKKWQTKQHIVKILWENYFGTTHDLTANNPDVSFLHYTARNTYGKRERVPVLKPLVDMFGVGLDQESRQDHVAQVRGLRHV
jgi:hypothetical protein